MAQADPDETSALDVLFLDFCLVMKLAMISQYFAVFYTHFVTVSDLFNVFYLC